MSRAQICSVAGRFRAGHAFFLKAHKRAWDGGHEQFTVHLQPLASEHETGIAAGTHKGCELLL